MTIKKLLKMPYAQAHVEISKDGDVYLFSYRTLVCELTKEGWLTCYGLYSSTTRRHIGAFMWEYVTYPNGDRGEYKTARDAYLNGYKFNINTGEIEEF